MSDIIHPRSPRETMDGWVYLPRFIDKIRLHLAGRLHADYRENFTKGFDGQWCEAAGVDPQQMIEVVRNTITDGEVCDWVHVNVKKDAAAKEKWKSFVMNRGRDTEELKARLKMRKEQSGLAHRDDIDNMVDYIDADEKRI